MRSHLIESCCGISLDIQAMQTITIIDVDGGQVADFFAECAGDPDEFLSSAG